jgi:hypothetical protein
MTVGIGGRAGSNARLARLIGGRRTVASLNGRGITTPITMLLTSPYELTADALTGKACSTDCVSDV